ncbi:MAG TPA: T9SS type A sorting domain-containing protein, partial [Bacteroidia bacterium]|nr:T9SS type A sorting domain-containing protein [Bacteroidia bacterium]
TLINSTDVMCFGNTTGNATVSVSGGVGSYTYSWVPSGGTGANASNLSAGTYTCQVTDANHCIGAASVLINQPAAALNVSTGILTNVSCNGGLNGSASLVVSGGTANYTYSWTPPSSNAAFISNVGAGTYTCTITDANACSTSASVTITEPPLLSASMNAPTDVSCNGGTNGSATLTAIGGTTGYTYSWTPSGGTGATANGLAAGTYTCTVTDANACTTSSTVSISEPAMLAASMGTPTDVSCNGGTNGSANISSTGGTSNYTYSWTPSGGTASAASNLAAGTYTCLVTDANACTTTATVSIGEPAAIAATSSATSALCGQSNGSASVNASGGSGTLTYSWSPVAGSLATLSVIPSGTYTCNVTDANGCSQVVYANVPNSNGPAVSLSQSTDVACFGNNSGNATVTVSGGVTPYTYSWDQAGGTAATASNLGAGTYTCQVSDANHCMGTVSVVINQPTAALSVSMGVPSNASCYGTSDGHVAVTVSGGTSAYTYSWSPAGGAMATASGLTAGTYTCSITDANGCSTSGNATIGQPSPVIVSVTSSSPSFCGGTADTLKASGAVTYLWSPAGGLNTTSGALVIDTAIANMTYTVTGTDGSGCVGSNSIPVVFYASPTIPIITESVGVLSTAATGVTYQWYLNGSIISGATGQTYTPSVSGNYLVEVTNGSGCSASSTAYAFTETGIISWVTAVNITVYPNPALGDVTFVITGGGVHTEIYLYDMLGKVIKAIPVITTRTTLFHDDLAEGVYLYRITSDQVVIGTGRLVLQK